ncbi:uncharacterized protein LOC135695522 [Rhopilema esculentum]|uniref:uncharacterized protein LOC135695522 n=1 Tax=Rhopilema esculentum TaxID=499914 RepID=UPI0031D5DC46|eukprot:gene11601-21838_t
MKTILILCAVAFMSATGWEIQFEEGDKEYKERIEVDVEKNVETFDVPEHNGLNHSVILNDFNVGLSAIKIAAVGKCYISKIDKDEYQSPKEMEKSLQQFGGRFPTDKYEVKKDKMVEVREMEKEEVGEKIAAFCQGYKMILTEEEDDETFQAKMKSLLEAASSGRSKRQLNELTLNRNICNGGWQAAIATFLLCPYPVDIVTRYRKTHCNYVVKCIGSGSVWNCNGEHIIKETSYCVDIVCR